MPEPRKKPYIWVTWLAALLSGGDSCEFKVWMKAHFTKLEKLELESGFDSAGWNEDHTAMLNELREEYRAKSQKLLIEGETGWKMEGRTATVAGRMDLVTAGPNLVIDAKSGRQKNSHVMQMKIYLLVAELGLVPNVSGKFIGVLRYPGNKVVEVPDYDDVFKQRFFELVKRIAGPEPLDPVPSKGECRFCDLAECHFRVAEEKVFHTEDF
jgi:CRISPR/Cas system-associated exonuclease Cas4 (RecB family)